MRQDTPQSVTGEVVYVRHFQHDKVGGVFPVRVVTQRSDGMVLWMPNGTTYWHFNMADGRTMAQTPLVEWVKLQRVPVARTARHHTLLWHPIGSDYSIRWHFRDDFEFYDWYGNLEEPTVFWRDEGIAGLDTVDWDLDVRIHPDRSWEMKDEEQFAARLAEPDVYWVKDEDRVREAAKDLIALAETAMFPFDGTWCDFRPDPAWPAISTKLPDGWDRPRALAAG